MRRSLLPCFLLAACFDPSTPAATGGNDDDDDGSSTGTMTSATSLDSTGMTAETTEPTITDTATTDPATTDPATTDPTTTDPATTDPATTDPTSVDTGTTEGESTTTGEPQPTCGDGLFAGDEPPFGAATLVAQLYNTQGIDVVDVDGDGDADLLVGDFGDASVTQGGIYFIEGNGDGTFQDAVKLPGDVPVVRIAAAAISDNTIDVVALVAEPPNFTVGVRRWRGNGDGSFLSSALYSAASDWDVALVDINGDGRRDLLGTSQMGARVSTANAAEVFAAYADHGGLATYSIKGGDVDGDGDGDIVAGASDSVIVLLGNGDGTFAAPIVHAVDETPIDSLIGDFDGDGNVDIGATGGALVWVFPGNGDGTWGARTDLTVQGGTLAGATPDFDADGCADITVFNNTGSVSTIMGRNDFTFTPQHIFNDVANGYAYDVAAGDIDGDGIADVVAVTAGGAPDTGGEVFVLRSGG